MTDTASDVWIPKRLIVKHADCMDVLRERPECSIDSIVTDPDYALIVNPQITQWGGVPGLEWAKECLRVLKPGGYLLAFGATRTAHRLACAIEDAGFEIRDSIAWLQGSGFPKSLNVSKAIDKAAGAQRETVRTPYRGNELMRQGGENTRPWMEAARESGYHERAGDEPATDAAKQWDGWGSALKPGHEPIIVARKPFSGTLVANVLTHGTGALNIDACRIGDEVVNPPGGTAPRNSMGDGWRTDAQPTTATGRWPANVVLDEDAARELDEQSGITKSPKTYKRSTTVENHVYGASNERPVQYGHADSGGASRFFYCAKASPAERPVVWMASCECDTVRVGPVEFACIDCGAAAKRHAHPTCKPVALLRWLVRLVTPPDGIVLDTFLGSGTTAEAALLEGFRCLGVEQEASYLPLIRTRLERAGLL